MSVRESAIHRTAAQDVSEQAESKDSVSIWFVRQALSGLHRHGHDPAPVLRAAGIPSALLELDPARVSAASFGALWLGIAAALDDELFGMDGRRMKVGSFALLSRAMARCPDLGQALQTAAQFFCLSMDDARVTPETGPDQARLVVQECRPAQRPAAYAVFAHETVLMMLHGLMCWLVGRRISLVAATFAHPRPPWWREYRAMFSSELAFDGTASVVQFDARVLAAVPSRSDDEVRAFLRHAPHNFVVKFRDRNSWSARIRRRLRQAEPAHWPDLARLSTEMGVALSTLHRRLDQEGTSFREIRDSLRRDLAIDLLTHSDARVAGIADALGFSEPSAFHRAFKLWTGARPGDYRQRAARTQDSPTRA